EVISPSQKWLDELTGSARKTGNSVVRALGCMTSATLDNKLSLAELFHYLFQEALLKNLSNLTYLLLPINLDKARMGMSHRPTQMDNLPNNKRSTIYWSFFGFNLTWYGVKGAMNATSRRTNANERV
ncbi:13073_t:CDS:2, partial [Acaulospora morrowiae]